MQKLVVLVTAGALAVFTILAVLKARFSEASTDAPEDRKRSRGRTVRK
jgi:hypothetical protein